MRLKYVYISQYKNLKEFTINFDGNSFVDVFVGKNGTGKSNLFEALIEIFRHLHKYDKKAKLDFNFRIKYEINTQDIEISYISGKLNINGQENTAISQSLLPDNVLIYYSGHNHTVTDLVEKYKQTFRKKIKEADFNESRYFIGIGSEYKELLLLVLLIQIDENKARQFICHKLDIKTVAPEIKLVLKRPTFADKKLAIDSFDPNTHYWGSKGITRQFLDKLVACIKGEFNHSDIYDVTTDSYHISINIELFQNKFKEETADIFRKFDNLKTLNMLAEILIPLTLTNGINTSTSHFSDGQFQSVYIYSIIEIFKNRNCLTLLDEPDSFLHPEWQFGFLKQVFDIADMTSKNNHVLMSSHSASTIITAKDSIINLFEFDGNSVIVNRINKADIVKSLSAGIILFSESEARLNINHVLKNKTGPILFTEGITDEMILETAWDKLYQGEARKFDVQQAFSCSFLRNLIKDENLYLRHPGRVFFSIFDFDEAYKDWNQMGQDIQTDPCKCLVKQYKSYQSFALLLPVPNNQIIQKQVINPNSGRTYGNKSLLTIELLFYGIDGIERYFAIDNERTDGFIKFISDGQKVTFAEDIVPNLDPHHFEVFRPIFEFIRSKCPT
jgi:predicted ATPase